MRSSPRRATARAWGTNFPNNTCRLAGRPMISHTLRTLCSSPRISAVFVVLAPVDSEWVRYDWSEFSPKLVVLQCGGATRAESVLNGLNAARAVSSIRDNDWVLVHDAARPCLGSKQLNKLMDELADDEVGGLLAVPVADTLKRSDPKAELNAPNPGKSYGRRKLPRCFVTGCCWRL